MLIDISPKSLEQKKVRRTLGGGGSIGPLPSIFDASRPIEIIFGTYNDRASFVLLIKRNHVVSNWFPRQP